ncbi:MAG: hypothetical protein FJ033_10605 [Chloroflexi bacterium]|nr:hypothetical protein [Chloroflexota bacterium]
MVSAERKSSITARFKRRISRSDPLWSNPRTRRDDSGPILSLLRNRQFDVVYLLITLTSAVDDYRKRATEVQRAIQRQSPAVAVRQRPVSLGSVTDYAEIYRAVNHECVSISAEHSRDDLVVYLSPGTPQMQTVWVLLVQSGLLRARMIEATPPDLLAPGQPPWREVTLSLADLPQIVSPGEIERRLGVLEARSQNLAVENRRLVADARFRNTATPIVAIGDDFSLPEHLLAVEYAY